MSTRKQIVAAPAQEIRATLPLAKVVQDGAVQRANRSSIWSKNEGSRQLRFHQGTPSV